MQRANRNRHARYIVEVTFNDGVTSVYSADRVIFGNGIISMTRWDPNTPDDVYRAIHVVSIPVTSVHEWFEKDSNPLCGQLCTDEDLEGRFIICELNTDHIDAGEYHAALLQGGITYAWPPAGTVGIDTDKLNATPGEFDRDIRAKVPDDGPLLSTEDSGGGYNVGGTRVDEGTNPIADAYNEARAALQDPYAQYRYADPYGGAGVG